MNEAGGGAMRSLLVLLFVSGTSLLYGQRATVAGTLLDEKNQLPVAGAIVQLLNLKGEVLAYSISAQNGAFSLQFQHETTDAVLVFRGLGYRIHKMNYSEIVLPLRVLLVPEPITLRDVVVSPGILQKKDTLVYFVRDFADLQDRTILDVLKKMPGIEVEESGQIRYNGEPINKFYMEGSDFVEGRYGLVTNNISHDDVGSVEVMENHQPIRVLQGIEHSEQAALNIRLKEDVKFRWMGTANAGLGVLPLLYDASLFAMRIGKKWQTIETVKANNTGWNPMSEGNRFTNDIRFSYEDDPLPDDISVSRNSPPLHEKRTRFNRSYLFNSTNAFKLNGDAELKANVNYLYDRLDYTQSSSTHYFDSSLSSLLESEAMRSQLHQLSGQLIFQTNRPEWYLKNNLTVGSEWNTISSAITGSYAIGQKATKPKFNIANDLQLAKRIGNRILTVISHNCYVRKPHSLTVGDHEEFCTQNVTRQAFQSATEAGYGWLLGRWQVHGKAGVELDYYGLESDLTGVVANSFLMKNDSRLALLKVYVKPDFVYESKRSRLGLSVPVSYSQYHFNDNVLQSRESKGYILASPVLSVLYKFTARWEASAEVRYALTPPQKETFYTGVLMNNYRYRSVGYPAFRTGMECSASASLRYRNPLSSLFIHLNGRYEWDNSFPVRDQLFTGDHIIETFYPLSYNFTTFRVNGGVSKGIVHGKIYLSVDVGYTRAKTLSRRNAVMVPCRMDLLSVMPKVKGTLVKWLSLEYTLLFTYDRMTVEKEKMPGYANNLRQMLTMTFFPVKKCQINLGTEHYYTRFDDKSFGHLFLLDAGIKWMFSDRIDFLLSATNLLNHREYKYSRFGALSETVYTYHIRPWNVMASARLRF